MKKSIISKLTCFALAIALALGAFGTLVGCDDNKIKKLDTPVNLSVSDEGVITWDRVANAEEYLISASSGMYISYENTYTLPDVTKSYTISVVAKAYGYEDSDASETVTFTPPSIRPDVPTVEPNVKIRSESYSVKSEGSLMLTAEVVGMDDDSVTWTLVSGGEYATLTNGYIQAKRIENRNQRLIVRAASRANPNVYAEREIFVVARQTLTQKMLEDIKGAKIDYSGMLDIDYYTTDLVPVYDGSAQISLRTGMDEDKWYAAYQNSINGVLSYIHFKNVYGYCNQVGISLMNTEEYFPVYDENRHLETWENAGLYNTFKAMNVTVSDFVFNPDTWRYDYKYNESDLSHFMAYTVSSANPHTFTPKNLSLIIDEGEIMGIYSESTDDPTIMNQRIARMRMTVGINVGENAVVRDAEMFPTDPNHAALTEAIAKTRAATSYKLDFRKQETMIAGGTMTTYTGYDEYVTQDLCYFLPYTFTSTSSTKNYTPFGDYGYKKIDDDLYNSFFIGDSGYQPSRAYVGDFESAKPSFAFAAEIFTTYAPSTGEDDPYAIYFADETMMTVASTFYKGVGTDAMLYGLYASMPWVGHDITSTNFSPYVVVDTRTGYIVEMMFYYNLYYMYGYINIQLSDFNDVTLPDGVTAEDIEFETRHIPTEWSQVTMIDDMDTDDTADDEEVPAHTFLNEFFEDENAAETIPFIGTALGDCFGFGMTRMRNFSWHPTFLNTVYLYYDVVMDLDYSIDSSIQAIEKYIMEEGFVLADHGVYTKGGYNILIEDSDLDLFVYVWKD